MNGSALTFHAGSASPRVAPNAVLILGATSAIARATASVFAKRGFALYLAGRDIDELQRIAADLQIRYGIHSRFGSFDAEAYETHGLFLQQVIEEMSGLRGVLVTFGDSGDQAAATNFDAAAQLIARNFTGAVSILTHCANYLETAGEGFIVAISSVAGDRGRQSNYVYGATKAALSVYLQGLRNRLFRRGVRVLTVKPGFVDTRMTFGRSDLFLVASPSHVGERIVRALEKSADIIYVPWFWRYVLLIIKMIPERIFKRLNL